MNAEEMNKAVKDNERLVYFILKRYYPTVQHDEDMIQVGMIGLWKALKTFEESRNVKFSIYATKIIISQINMEFRRRKKHSYTVSIETVITEFDKDGSGITLEDTLSDNLNGVEDYSSYILESFIKNDLDEREKQIMHMLFLGYTQKKIGLKLGLSQSYISRIITSLKAKFKKIYGKEINL